VRSAEARGWPGGDIPDVPVAEKALAFAASPMLPASGDAHRSAEASCIAGGGSIDETAKT